MAVTGEKQVVREVRDLHDLVTPICLAIGNDGRLSDAEAVQIYENTAEYFGVTPDALAEADTIDTDAFIKSLPPEPVLRPLVKHRSWLPLSIEHEARAEELLITDDEATNLTRLVIVAGLADLGQTRELTHFTLASSVLSIARAVHDRRDAHVDSGEPEAVAVRRQAGYLLEAAKLNVELLPKSAQELELTEDSVHLTPYSVDYWVYSGNGRFGLGSPKYDIATA